MSTPRLRRLASACRHLLFLTLGFSLQAAGVRAAEPAITGMVLDQSGRPVPRAAVRAMDAAGSELRGTIADEDGQFALSVTAASHCTVVASLPGFQSARLPCRTDAPLRFVLMVSPIKETVIVTATGTEAPSSQIGASTTTFTEEVLEERQRPLVADLLRSTPGAMIVRSGGLGTVASLFVRGGESNYNKVLLDGIPLNEPGGTFNFSNVTTDNLERVEIVRGAHSALFGSDAMSSVVQLFTKRGDGAIGPPHVSLSLEGGTFDTGRGMGSVSGKSGRMDYSFGAARLVTDNTVPNNDFKNTTLSANVGFALSDTATLRVIGRGELEHVGTPGQTEFGRPDLDAFFERHDGTAGVSFEQRPGSSIRQRASYSLAVSSQQSTNLRLDAPYTPQFDDRTGSFEFFDFAYDSRTKLHRHHASYQADWHASSDPRTGAHLLTFLADWDGERARLEDRLAATETVATRNNFGWSVQDQASWARTFVTIGGRVEHNDSFGTSAVPRGSVVFVARAPRGTVGETLLKASAGLGIKEPTVLQSFSPSPFFLGNPSLAPERSRTVDVGIEQRLASDRAKVELTWFDNRYKNLISTETTSFDPFRSQYFNIGLTQARGAELTVEVAPFPELHARGGYTFLDSEVLESTSPFDPVFATGQWLFRRPRHSGFFEANWSRQRVNVNVIGVFIGQYIDSDFSALQPPIVMNQGHTTWDLRASYRLARQLAILLSIDNLADASYMEPLGYQGLGRAIRIGTKVDF